MSLVGNYWSYRPHQQPMNDLCALTAPCLINRWGSAVEEEAPPPSNAIKGKQQMCFICQDHNMWELETVIEFAIKIRITDIVLNRKYFIYNFARTMIRSL